MVFFTSYGEDIKRTKKIHHGNILTTHSSFFWRGRILLNILLLVAAFWPNFVPTEGGIACLSNPCLFGLCVDDVNSSYSCFCQDGYTGVNCQSDWNECWSQPCLHGGECLDLVANFNCSCPEGFSGRSCEFDRDECSSQPCFNNATCVDASNGFHCECLPGYAGLFCEVDVSVCNATGTSRCLHGGVCIEGPGEKFWCECQPGWQGTLCEEAIDPCILLQPCQHGGLCLSRGEDFICACPFGFKGTRCEQELSLCDHNPCLNGAICVEESSNETEQVEALSVCYCVPDFHGDLCQYQYDECLLPPTPSCRNGGTCIDGVDGFTCSCPPDVTGRYCECPLGQDCSNLTYHPELSSHHPLTTSLPQSVTSSTSPATHPYFSSTRLDGRTITARPHLPPDSSISELPTISTPSTVTSIETTEGEFSKTTPFETGAGSDEEAALSSVTTIQTSTIEISEPVLTTPFEDGVTRESPVLFTSTESSNLGAEKWTASSTSENISITATSSHGDISSNKPTMKSDEKEFSSQTGSATTTTSESSSETAYYTTDTFSVEHSTFSVSRPGMSTMQTFTWPTYWETSLDSTNRPWGTIEDQSETTSVEAHMSTTFGELDRSSTLNAATSTDSTVLSTVSTPLDTHPPGISDSDDITTTGEEMSTIFAPKVTPEPEESGTSSTDRTTEISTPSSGGTTSGSLGEMTTMPGFSSTVRDGLDVSEVDEGSVLRSTSDYSGSTTWHEVTSEPAESEGVLSSSPSVTDEAGTSDFAHVQSTGSDIVRLTSPSTTNDLTVTTEGISFDTSGIASTPIETHSTEIYPKPGRTHLPESQAGDESSTPDSSLSITTDVPTDQFTSTDAFSISTAKESEHDISPLIPPRTLPTTKSPTDDPTSSLVPKTSTPSSKTLKPVTEDQILDVSEIPTRSSTSPQTPSKAPGHVTLEVTTPYFEGTSHPFSTPETMEPSSCEEQESPCLNGGTCVVHNSIMQCRCALQFTGSRCELFSNYTEVSLLPTSWLLFRVLTPASAEDHEDIDTSGRPQDEGLLSFTHHLEAVVRVVSEEGVIFTLAEAEEGHVPGYHMQMSLHRGRLRLQFSCGLQSVRFSESKQRIDTGYPTVVSASLSVWSGNASFSPGKCRAELRLNASLAVSGEQLRPLGSMTQRHAALAHLVFGAWPRGRSQRGRGFGELVTLHHEALEEQDEIGLGPSAPGVIACLSGVKVNGRLRLLLADVTAGTSDVTPCTQLACLSNPCLHGGICEETPSASWSCRCPTGRVGARCESSVCSNSPCEGGGTCLVHPGTNFVCLCPFGRQGVFCEQELIVTQPCLSPALVGVSPHLAFPLSPKHASFRHGLELGLRFTAARTHQVAILAYLGHGPRDHMALSYVHGRVMLTWDLGSGPRRIYTTREFSGGAEQEARMGRSGRLGWLRVRGENGTLSGHSAGKMTQLNTRPVLLIGGFDRGNVSLLPHDLPKHSGFEGCISHVEIKTGQNTVSRFFPQGPPASPLRGRAVSQKGKSACASNPCLHRGICLPHGPSFTCLCAQGWFGPVCAELRNPCDTQANLCAEGSTCVPLLKGYECDCPLGRTGQFCKSVETRGAMVWPEVYFTGRRSYLEVPRAPNTVDSTSPEGSSVPEHSCVEFEMKPSSVPADPESSAAQVLFFSQDKDSGDFMTLIMTSDRALQLILGSGEGTPLTLRSARGALARPGAWVRIRAGRVGRRVFLSVGGRPVSTWLLPGQAGDWSGGATSIFLGGAPDLSTVASLVWSAVRPFRGCVRRLHVDWRKVLVHLGKARPSTPSRPGNSRLLPRELPRPQPEVVQLMPEYLKQVQMTENLSPSSRNEDLTSILQHEFLASYISGLQRQKLQHWKSAHQLDNFFKQKVDSLVKSNHDDLEKSSTTTAPTTTLSTTEGSSTSPPLLLSRNLRSKDALYASGARNVRPCDKSSPALLPMENCEDSEGQQSCRENQQYQVEGAPEGVPKFSGNGWLQIRVPPSSTIRPEFQVKSAPFSFLRLRFSAHKAEGLILWVQQDTSEGSFLGVGLLGGRLRVVWGTGGKLTKATLIAPRLADGEFHSVSVIWEEEVSEAGLGAAHVWVDGEEAEVEREHENSRRKRREHNAQVASTTTNPPFTIFLGGFPEDRGSVTAGSRDHFTSALHGCVAELAWDEEVAQLGDFKSYPHQNLEYCADRG